MCVRFALYGKHADRERKAQWRPTASAEMAHASGHKDTDDAQAAGRTTGQATSSPP